MNKYLIWLTFFCFPLPAFASCRVALTAPTSFAKPIALTTGHRLFVRFETPVTTPKGYFFLVHGLLQDETSFDGLAKILLQDGFAVIRPDLYGFGRSFDPLASQGTIDFEDNVADLKALLEVFAAQYGVRDTRLVGHSMGGGLIASLVRDPAVRAMVASPVTLLAPYVYRLEFYLADRATGMSFFDSSPSLRLFDNLPFFVRFGSESVLSAMAEPQLRMLFNSVLKLEDSIDHRQLRVKSAIATVRGLRNLNTFDCLKEIPDEFGLQLVLGRRDMVVDANLERKLGGAIRRKSGKFIELNAGHMMLDEVPEEIARILLEPRSDLPPKPK